MKRIFLGMMLIAFMATPVLASNDGGKKKARKKAKTERKMEKCDPKNCDPKNCDLKKCDPKCIELADCKKEATCSPTPACSGK